MRRSHTHKPTIIVHELAHARAVLRAADRYGIGVSLRTAPGAVRYAGVAFFKAMFEQLRHEKPDAECHIVLDCGGDAALAHRALREGFRHLAFSGSKAMRVKLADIAAGLGAEISALDTAGEALDLLDSREPAADCEAYLSRFRR